MYVTGLTQSGFDHVMSESPDLPNTKTTKAQNRTLQYSYVQSQILIRVTRVTRVTRITEVSHDMVVRYRIDQ